MQTVENLTSAFKDFRHVTVLELFSYNNAGNALELINGTSMYDE